MANHALYPSILAKSSGETLYDHSVLVAEVGKEMAQQALLYPQDKVVEYVNKACLLHDIGKVCKHFQKRLKHEDPDSLKSIPFRHNEIGWAFLQKHLNVDHEELALVLDAVYWHHGITNDMNAHHAEDILAKVPGDIGPMKQFVIDVLGEGMIRSEGRGSEKAPKYFSDDRRDAATSQNTEYRKMFVRSCVISADRLVSSLKEKPIDIKMLVEQETLMSGSMVPTRQPYVGARFEEQQDIALKAKKTAIVKAPAGFGKTLVGLLWSMRSRKKLVWVCPRNMVAESVYDSINKELNALGINVSVELYLSGQRQKPTQSEFDGFEADIIITNVDSFLFPTIRNSIAHRQFFISNCDVVFDEFHEVVDENALFACYVNIMRLRHRMTKSRTLLLSATPITMARLWDSFERTQVLPDENKHYGAAHGKKYKVNVVPELPKLQGGANLVVVNSINMAQTLKMEMGIDKIVHSAYEAPRRAAIFDEILGEFGKESERKLNKSNVVSVLVLQASLDVSFAHLYESVSSPESTLQRIGRCNRWGDYQGVQPTLNFFFDNKGAERTIRSILYETELSYAWFDVLSKCDGREMTLDELYDLYNAFANDHASEIRQFIDKRLTASEKQLSSIYPPQIKTRKRGEVKHADSNPLRSNGNQVFYIVKNPKDGTFTEAFTHTLRKATVEEDFNMDRDSISQMDTLLKMCIEKHPDRFDFERIVKEHDRKGKIWRMNWDRIAKLSNTPCIRVDKVYDDEYGIIDAELYKKLNRNPNTN